MTRRRVMLFEVTPRRPTARVYASLNPDDKASSVALSAGNLTATRSGAGGFNQGVRLDTAMASGSWYWETQYSAGTLTAADRAGLVRGSFSTTGSAGSDVYVSIGGPRSNGSVRYNGADTATGFGTLTSSDTICHWFDASTCTYRVRLNGGSWFTVVSQRPEMIGRPWYPYLQCGLTGGASIRTDPSTFLHAPPDGVNAGIYRDSWGDDPDPLYLASEPFGSDDGKGTSFAWLARIDAKSDAVIERSVSPWPLGGRRSNRGGSIAVLNGDRRLDDWLEYQWRDAPYVIHSGYEGDDFADFEVWTRGVVDKMSHDRGRIVLALADPLTRLDRPLQTASYPPDVGNAQIAGQPLPLCLGSPRIVPGVLLTTDELSADAFSYQVHDEAIVGSTIEVFDKGDELTLFSDFEPLYDSTGVRLYNKPETPVTANPDSISVTDSLAPATGVADEFGLASGAWSGSPLAPEGWDNTSSGTGTVTAQTAGARFLKTTGAGQAELTLPTAGGIGEVHLVELVVSGTVTGNLEVDFGGSISGFGVISEPGTYRVIGTVGPSTNDVKIRLTGTLLTPSLAGDMIIQSAKVGLFSVIERLPIWMKYLAVNRAGLTAADLDTTAIEALDTKAPYRLAHWTQTPETILPLLQRTLDSFCGWVTTNRAGQITVGRLEAMGGGSGKTAALRLNSGNILSIKGGPIDAPGLTRRLAGRKNHRVHTDAELAGSVSGGDDLSLELRAQFTSEWLSVRTATPGVTENLNTGAEFAGWSPTDPNTPQPFAHADGAPPQPTLLQDEDDIQAEIDRVSALFTGGRAPDWYDIDCALSPEDADAIELGASVFVTYPIDDFDAGRWGMILSATTRFHARRVSLGILFLPETA